MSSAIQKLTLYLPIIASSSIFAARRIGRGVDAMDENPLFGTANFVIAGGQTLKGLRAANDMTTHSAAGKIISQSNTLKGLPVSSKFLKGLGKVFNFASQNINRLICGASVIKVLGSDDKMDAAVRETLGLGLMFSCEKAAKAFLGMPDVKKNAKGVIETVRRTPLYKTNPFLRAQADAINDLFKEKMLYQKIMKSSIPGAAKGILFVCASIAGYKLGSLLANWLLGKDEPQNTAKRIKMNNVPVAQNDSQTAKRVQMGMPQEPQLIIRVA